MDGITISLAGAARLALVAITYIYTVKMIDTLWHGIFCLPLSAAVVVCLNILAGCAQVYFFILLSAIRTVRSKSTLTFGSWFGIIGSTFLLLPKFLAAALLLQYPLLFPLMKRGSEIGLFGPWLGSLFLFLCCCMFASVRMPAGHPWGKPFLSAATGYLIVIAIYSNLIRKYFSGIRVIWAEGEIGISTSLFVVSSTIVYLLIAYLFYWFGFSKQRNFQ